MEKGHGGEKGRSSYPSLQSIHPSVHSSPSLIYLSQVTFHSLNPVLLYPSISYQSIFHPSHSVHSFVPPPFYKSSFYLSIMVLICPYLLQSFLNFFIPPFPQYFDPAFFYPFFLFILTTLHFSTLLSSHNFISASLQCFIPLSFALIYPSSLTALHFYVPPCSLTSFFPPSLQSSPNSTPLFALPLSLQPVTISFHLSILSCFSSSLHLCHHLFRNSSPVISCPSIFFILPLSIFPTLPTSIHRFQPSISVDTFSVNLSTFYTPPSSIIPSSCPPFSHVIFLSHSQTMQH